MINLILVETVKSVYYSIITGNSSSSNSRNNNKIAISYIILALLSFLNFNVLYIGRIIIPLYIIIIIIIIIIYNGRKIKKTEKEQVLLTIHSNIYF